MPSFVSIAVHFLNYLVGCNWTRMRMGDSYQKSGCLDSVRAVHIECKLRTLRACSAISFVATWEAYKILCRQPLISGDNKAVKRQKMSWMWCSRLAAAVMHQVMRHQLLMAPRGPRMSSGFTGGTCRASAVQSALRLRRIAKESYPHILMTTAPKRK